MMQSKAGLHKRRFGLDVLRAAAIVGVFVAHEVNIRVAGANLTEALGSGVELFFVLSGFLIGGICFRSVRDDRFSFLGFWRSRWLRTLPPYIAALFFYLAMHFVVPTALPPLNLSYWVFLQNYLGISGFQVSWSLCIEEQFYLTLPILVFLVVKFLGLRALRYLLPLAFFGSAILRFGTWWLTGELPTQWYWLSHLHFEGLTAGVWLAYLSTFDKGSLQRLRRPSWWLSPLPFLLIIGIPFISEQPMVFRLLLFTLYALGFAAWLVILYDFEISPSTRIGSVLYKSITGIALCSYSVYLTHTTFDPWMRTTMANVFSAGVVRSLIVMVPTWSLGVVFYFLFERPAIVFRDKWIAKHKTNPMAVLVASN
jgi:peptidoglycan/LPS O-acetylase OafA/YrhL